MSSYSALRATTGFTRDARQAGIAEPMAPTNTISTATRCDASRGGEAPSEMRMPACACCAEARARNRPATFAVQMIKRTPTAAKRNQSGCNQLRLALGQVLREFLDDLRFARRVVRGVPQMLANHRCPVRHRLPPGSGFDGPNAGHALQGLEEGAPDAALLGKHASPGGRETVVPAAPLARLFQPAADDEPAFLEAVERRVERRNVERQGSGRALLDELAQFVAVPGPLLHERQDEQFGASLLGFTIKHGTYIYVSSIYVNT